MKPYYEHAGITIYHADCRDVLPQLDDASIDLLLTDPPYGQQFCGRGEKTASANIRADGARQGMRLVRQALFEVVPKLRQDAHAYIFCHWEGWPDFYDAVSAYMPIKNALVWWKDRGGMGDTELEYARDFEIILYAAHGRRALSGRRDGAVITGYPPPASATRFHPTEKPVALLQYIITKSCPVAGVVVDMFAGSCSTLVAAKNVGRKAVGVEIEERYCEIAAKRLSQDVLPLGSLEGA